MEFYICDLRPEWRWRPYVTFWRPNNANYAYPLPWSGRYTLAEVEDGCTYYYKPRYETKRAVDRFPVPCEVVEKLAVAPRPGIVDGNVGPVVEMTAANLRKLRKAAYRPKSVTAEVERNARHLS